MAKKRRVRKIIRSKKSSSFGRVKFSPFRFGHALGLVSVIALLFYTIMSWFSDFNGSIIINQFPLSFSFNDWTIVIGLLQTYVMSYIGGWIFAKMYNGVTI